MIVDQRQPQLLVLGATGDSHPGHGEDGGKCLASETVRPQRLEVFLAGHLGGVAGENEQREVVLGDSATVVQDVDPLQPIVHLPKLASHVGPRCKE